MVLTLVIVIFDFLNKLMAWYNFDHLWHLMTTTVLPCHCTVIVNVVNWPCDVTVAYLQITTFMLDEL